MAPRTAGARLGQVVPNPRASTSVPRLSLICRIQLQRLNAQDVRALHHVVEECSSKAAAPITGMRQHHTDPSQPPAVADQGGCSHQVPAGMNAETAVGIKPREHAPV